jgi:hypothetical protein
LDYVIKGKTWFRVLKTTHDKPEVIFEHTDWCKILGGRLTKDGVWVAWDSRLTPQVTRSGTITTIVSQTLVGMALGVMLAGGGFLRVYLSKGDLADASAIALALLVIVTLSTLIGEQQAYRTLED